MAGIYIPDMEMPKNCFYCPFRLKVDPDTFVCLATNEHIEETFSGTIEMRNRGDCPLVPVPDHGRLIDADAYEYPGDLKWEPTIIPAEEGET